MQPGKKVTIKTPEQATAYLAERSDEDEITGCWVWRCSCTGDGRPKLTFGSGTPVRRWAWEKIKRKKPDPDKQVLCNLFNGKCVAPDHMILATHAQKMAMLGKAGRLNYSSDRRAEVRKKRRQGLPYNMADIEAAKARRAAGEKLATIAADYKVHFSTVHRWCTGVRWQQHAPGASVFNLAGSRP